MISLEPLSQAATHSITGETWPPAWSLLEVLFFFFWSLFVSKQGLIQPGLVSYVAKDGTCDALAQPGGYF